MKSLKGTGKVKCSKCKDGEVKFRVGGKWYCEAHVSLPKGFGKMKGEAAKKCRCKVVAGMKAHTMDCVFGEAATRKVKCGCKKPFIFLNNDMSFTIKRIMCKKHADEYRATLPPKPKK